MEFSESHLSAFRSYRARGFSLKGLTTAQVDALAEDPNFAAEVSAHRRTVADEAARAAAAPPPATPVAATRRTPIDATVGLTVLKDDASEADLNAWMDAQRATLPTPFFVAATMWKWVDALQDKVLQLATRIKELEARAPGAPSVKYAGIYNPHTRYSEGQLVTRSGGLWLAVRDSISETPGSSTAFLLVVKRGDAVKGDT